MKRAVVFAVLSLLIAAGSVLASPLAPQASMEEDALLASIFGPAGSAPVSADWKAERALRCTATTTCTDGTTKTCTSTALRCFTEPRCYVQCDGVTFRCSSPCP